MADQTVTRESAPGPAAENGAACELGPETGTARADHAFRVRLAAAEYERNLPLPEHPCNGDEHRYPNRIASYSKALPHNDLGEVDAAAYDALLKALDSGDQADFDRIPLGGSRKLANPRAALAFSLEGPDSHHLGMPVAPTFDSAEEAAEMGEVYWQALTRDVPFAEYRTNRLTRAAAEDLSRFSAFEGPKANGEVTTGTLFRGSTPGDLAGPYISQFLARDVPYGAQTVAQRYKTAVPGRDYMVAYGEWLAIQEGASGGTTQLEEGQTRYIRNGRDLGEYVHRDFTYQAFLNATLILLQMKVGIDGDPYARAKAEEGFVTFGAGHILDFVGKAAREALKAAWYQKWLVHRRLRPEAFGGRVHNHRAGRADYPIHHELLRSSALRQVFRAHGSYLLPMAYAEGSPTHTAYPAGHAAISGACATMLKAFFDESHEFGDVAVAAPDGLSLQFQTPTTDERLTVGGELNKLASNVSLGRDAAGVHWRSDGIEGLKLGEEVVIRILTEEKLTYPERFPGFALTGFDGTLRTV
ncbi:MAG: vanadium-dependent haloperoxidase [Actinomycetota bacterium]|nr:vanadium-dependent haloperoxidase [Actinomycetota bacterium]